MIDLSLLQNKNWQEKANKKKKIVVVGHNDYTIDFYYKKSGEDMLMSLSHSVFFDEFEPVIKSHKRS